MNPTILACIQPEDGQHHAPTYRGSLTRVGHFVYLASRYSMRSTVQGAVHSHVMSPLDYLNRFDGLRVVQVLVDGIRTRDVQ